MSVPSVSVVIPVKNAAAYLPSLLPRILEQLVPPEEILLLDSASTDGTAAMASEFEGVRVVPVERFSHGGTRNLGVREAGGEFVVFLTQDALPRDDTWLSALLRPFEDPMVAYAFSRQVPRDDAPPPEVYYLTREFPDRPRRYVAEDGKVSDLKQVFASNVSSAARRSAALEIPFDPALLMMEDQQLSRDLQRAGHAVAYVPESVVIHSHRYTLLQTFRRYFDSVAAMRQVFPDLALSASASTGVGRLKDEAAFLARRHPLWLPYWGLQIGMKTLATLLAHRHERLPAPVKRWCGMHRYWWEDAPGTRKQGG